jgi:hypothetical protein
MFWRVLSHVTVAANDSPAISPSAADTTLMAQSYTCDPSFGSLFMLVLLSQQSGVSPRGMPPPMSPSQRAVGLDMGSSLREFANTGV